VDIQRAARAIAESTAKPVFNTFDSDTYQLDTAVQLRVSLGDKQQSLDFARMMAREFTALAYRLQQPGVTDKQAALDLQHLLKTIQASIRRR
jgi:hypothetical protein